MRSGRNQATFDKSHRAVSILVFFLRFLSSPLLVLGVNRLRYELRSYALLTHFVDPQASGPLLRFETNAVSTEDVAIETNNGLFPAACILPTGIAKPHGIVVLPGIHHLGIYDPRFINFSRALAASGFAVLTPVLASLADYRVDAASIPTIGASPAWLERRLGTGPVTVIALSFSGGLALLAACDPQYAPHMRALVLFGGYENLERVARFLATGQEEFPDGRILPAPAHDYGASVFVYAHLPQFFDPKDIPAAHEALKYWLWEEPQNAEPSACKAKSARPKASGRTHVPSNRFGPSATTRRHPRRRRPNSLPSRPMAKLRSFAFQFSYFMAPQTP